MCENMHPDGGWEVVWEWEWSRGQRGGWMLHGTDQSLMVLREWILGKVRWSIDDIAIVIIVVRKSPMPSAILEYDVLEFRALR